jgi:3',5'-cyclic AMP phosphodiesterase CpdA
MVSVVRIAHLSDLHLLDLEGAVPSRLANKRLTGWVNIRLHRGYAHKPAPVHAAGAALRDLGVEHVVVTGDVTNLALEREFSLVRDFLDGFGYAPADVSVVPGNHDAYTRGSHDKGRFLTYLGAFAASDPELGVPRGFPFVRIRGPAAIIGLSSAVPRPPLVASGRLGDAQIAALERILRLPEVAARTPVVLCHHPPLNPPSIAKTLLEGLTDAHRLTRTMSGAARGLVLHGHLHRRIHRRIATRAGSIDAVGATSASLLHPHVDRMAGFNVYDVDDDGAVGRISAYRFSEATRSFEAVEVPLVA